MEEIWKPVVGYEGIYDVSNLGRVRKCCDGTIIKQFRWGGYKFVGLRKDGKTKTLSVHRLVAFAFVKKPELIVNHKNEIKVDNRAENLEWCTHSYNTTYNDSQRKGREKASTRSCYEEKHREIGNTFRRLRKEAGLSGIEVARLAKVSESLIYRIELGRTTFSLDFLESVANVYEYTFELIKIADKTKIEE